MTRVKRPTPAITFSRSRGGIRSPRNVPSRPPASTVAKLSSVPLNHIGWLVCERMDLPPSERLRYWAHELGGMAKTGLIHAPTRYHPHRYQRTLPTPEPLPALTIPPHFPPT